jgi:hypothetical protein
MDRYRQLVEPERVGEAEQAERDLCAGRALGRGVRANAEREHEQLHFAQPALDGKLDASVARRSARRAQLGQRALELAPPCNRERSRPRAAQRAPRAGRPLAS